MATTVSFDRDDVITAALRRLRIVASGDSGTASEVTDAAFALNMLMLELNHDPRLSCNLDTQWESVAITAGANSVQVASADYIGIMAAYYDDGAGTVQELTPKPFEQIMATSNNNDIADDTPQFFWNTRLGITANTIFVSPAPTANGTIYFFPKKRMDLFDNAADTLSLPDAWARYLIRALTADLAWEFGKSLSEIRMHEQLAEKSKELLITWETQAIQQMVSDMMATNRKDV